MSNAKSILAERLAKGDITDEEFDRLSAKIDSSSIIEPISTSDPASISPSATSQAATSKTAKNWKPLGLAAAVILGLFMVNGIAADRLTSGVKKQCEARGLNISCDCFLSELRKELGPIYIQYFFVSASVAGERAARSCMG